MEQRREEYEHPIEPTPRVVRPMETRQEPYETARPEYRFQDLVRWGPVFAGFFLALSGSVLLGVLGVAMGLTTPTGAAIWAALTAIVAFFLGGWLAAQSSTIGDPLAGAIHGVIVWALMLGVLFLLGAISATAGPVNALLGPLFTPPPGTPGGQSVITNASWGTFAVLLIGLIAAVAGGYIGGRERYPLNA